MDLRAGVDAFETRVTSHLSGIELRIDQPLALLVRFPYRMSMMQKNAGTTRSSKQKVGSVC